ncbi:MAG: UDP-N-acetylmuramate dehydrogenase [Bacteroidaceae bacterium]|nr:UDP-N-acetylmuramate dehydrogenase [Bacteroidaceae bacterium]MBQ9285953.1 UDP-N-acetylmuramate dehydrogenase [Bacteroidaceae bacterium]
MKITENCSLKEHNTFGIEAKAHKFVEYSSVEELQAFIRQRSAAGDSSPLLHIGGGSNLLFLGDYEGTILHSSMQEIYVTANEGDYVYVRVTAGITWDAWVQYAIDSNWFGLENLSLIPGEVGASAVQNIGAYGSEAKDFIIFVDAVDLETGEIRHFTAEECRYGYRDSAFKHELRGRYAVTHVHFRLSHAFRPILDYGGLRRAIEERGFDETNLTPQQLRQTIIEIRRAKLPEPSELGNAGSFFTNPFVAREVFEKLAAENPSVPHYDVDAERVKVPAGWLIEQCGWKGKALGKAGVYDRQALVLVNLGGATGKDIKALCEQIQADVRAKFGINITPEVNFI